MVNNRERLRTPAKSRLHLPGLFCLSLLLLLGTPYCFAREVSQNARHFTRDQLIQDVRQLARLVEEFHPDPYINGGGKILFHKRLQETLRGIPEEGMTVEDFYWHLRPFVTGIGDAHTSIYLPERRDASRPGGIPLIFSLCSDGVYVQTVFDPELEKYLGARLVSVEGVPLDVLTERLERFVASRNPYWMLRRLAYTGFLFWGEDLSRILPEWEERDSISLHLQVGRGSTEEVSLVIPERLDASRRISRETRVPMPASGDVEFDYTFLDDRKQTALLVINGMRAYRELYEIHFALGVASTEERARSLYSQLHEGEPPRDRQELLAGLPSATETFQRLIDEMKAAGTENLIIDLRRNGGGVSFLADILIYMFFGEERLLETGSLETSVEIISPEELEQTPGDRIAQRNRRLGFDLQPGDYLIEPDSRYGTQSREDRLASARSLFETQTHQATTFEKLYESGSYCGEYRPARMIAISSPRTFSSGYTLLYHLYRAGVETAGVPSGQEGNAFGDIRTFPLDHSRVEIDLSTEYYLHFPRDPEMGRVLMPHHLFTYDDLVAHDFDPNAEILFVLEILRC